jgi:hypothetical protein
VSEPSFAPIIAAAPAPEKVISKQRLPYEGLLSDCIAPHTWMLFRAGWSAAGDWPDLAATGAPSPLLVQFLLDDALFTVDGMRNADSRIATAYAQTGEQNAYRGEFYPGPHRFDVPMQEAAFVWLQHHL